MDEATWLACEDPIAMLNSEGEGSDRQLRLFACACCRLIWDQIKDPACRQAVEAAELFADGRITAEELNAIYETAENSKPLFADASWAATWCARPTAFQAAEVSSVEVSDWVGRTAAEKSKSLAWAAVRSGATEEQKSPAWGNFDSERVAAVKEHDKLQAALLREIMGNPFRTPASCQWPATILELAQAHYDGADCAFALADALEEAGQSEFAEHCRVTSWHPRGCWVVDLILEKS
jgi:glycine/D-amino acid oxidase-like deaminating enzyme